ncbi:Aminoglycoside phosphotransferase [Cordyceps militaris CM01]|uniref:Aminoglycoside phosphotransferase n=1 Tax=Cordyceps militaris (strain CM01) TaxID=983644 RepID=G3JIG7_CORMM|nr:Aminoglycoside phosphotransferase [Cordyceps militaris CM01]EGX91068.1 Aminoglycoside phosphotransferase [Cordyceps militaris CM01]
MPELRKALSRPAVDARELALSSVLWFGSLKRNLRPTPCQAATKPALSIDFSLSVIPRRKMAEYSADDEIAAFFKKTTATRSQCETKARQLTGSNKIEPVAIQGACSYTVYAGERLEYVVQCRLSSLALKTELSDLATAVYGSFVPTVSLHGELGHGQDQESGKEPLLVYLMTRMPGITQLDFILSHDVAQSSPEFFPSRQYFFADVASFLARSWLTPQNVSSEYRDKLKASYLSDLHALEEGLPERFKPAIQTCLRSLDDIMALPMVLLHKDFGSSNVLVEKDSCHLTGVIDWAEASIGPFGTNLHSIQSFAGSMHLRNGWTRFPDYEAFEQRFWSTLGTKVGGLSEETVITIKKARVLGLLLSHGFTSRLANEAAPAPLKDDDHGRYHTMYLDGYLVNPSTKMDGAP